MLNGEYRTDDLEDLLIRVTHLKSSLEAYEKYGENRQHVLVFAVTIKHAEALTGIFSKAGYNAAYVHSETTNRERRNTLRYFEIGNIQFLINVGVLTEGWDSPKVNLIMLCRPTKSAGLYVQMVGRGSRVTKDKENVLILDMVNNFREHGHPSNPEVKYPKKPPSPEPALLIKTCPNCFEVLNISIKICPFCGHEFCTDAPEVNKSPVMEEVYFNKYGEKVMYQKRFKSKNQKNEPFVAVSAKIAAVSMTPHIIRSEKNYGKRMGNLTFTLEKAPNEYIKIKYFIDVENAIGALAYNRFKRVWDFLKTGGTYPGTIAEAIKGIQNADPPAWVHYYENENGYFCLAELENVKKEKSC
jgi:superfamily II DNA or RNA helicase